MPIFEYICNRCQASFEKLVQAEEIVECPGCNSDSITKQYSRFGLGAGSGGQKYESLPLYKSGGCGCTPSSCGCKN